GMEGHRGVRGAGGGADVPPDRHPRRIAREGTRMTTRTNPDDNTPDTRPQTNPETGPQTNPGTGPQTSPVRAGVGVRVRVWWNGLARPVQWGVLVPVAVLVYLLPVLNPPLIATTGTDFPTAMFDVARYALV